jgi:hypothetical protein
VGTPAVPLQSTHQEQDNKDDNDETYTTAWIPAITVIPRANAGSADKREDDENDYQYPK